LSSSVRWRRTELPPGRRDRTRHTASLSIVKTNAARHDRCAVILRRYPPPAPMRCSHREMASASADAPSHGWHAAGLRPVRITPAAVAPPSAPRTPRSPALSPGSARSAGCPAAASSRFRTIHPRCCTAQRKRQQHGRQGAVSLHLFFIASCASNPPARARTHPALRSCDNRFNVSARILRPSRRSDQRWRLLATPPGVLRRRERLQPCRSTLASPPSI